MSEEKIAKYNKEIKKLKKDRNGNRFMAGVYGVVSTACGGGIASWMYLLKNHYAFSPPYTIRDLILIPWFGIPALAAAGFAISCYNEIAESRKTSKKIRELEKGLT